MQPRCRIKSSSETDLQECKDKEVTMTEEVDVGGVGQLALVESMDNICTSVRTTAAATALLLQRLHAGVLM